MADHVTESDKERNSHFQMPAGLSQSTVERQGPERTLRSLQGPLRSLRKSQVKNFKH